MGQKSFLERDSLRMGIIGTAILIAAMFLALNFNSIPGVNGATTYRGEFADASGLAVGDTAQIAGVKVGTVKNLDLGDQRVIVEFDLDTGLVTLGEDTRAAIKVETALGRRYLEITPGVHGELSDGATIPLAQTSSGYDITRALEEVTGKVSDTDTVNLAGALEQISAVEDELPPDLRSSLDGLSRLSDTVASRDTELRELLAGTAEVSQILADRDDQVAALMGQGQSLFAAIDNRADTIHRVLEQSRQVADALTGLARDNTNTLGPTLDQLKTLVATLNGNYDNINESLTGLDRFAKQVGEAVGSGPFFGVLLHNILPANLAGQLPGSLGGPR
ncbi:MAG: MCE family protein [Rhodococcus qingshengii]|jgi:phospholipid/cholesterol/gamma-HCH transport system substrate-binding protein|uniref:MCE family protein n=1 Tax=Rhodococcus globerulus TaxID=33008 RepID=UPI001F3025BD|nr:MCE family protein [Rhodococcus globerulus]MCE4268458.1 MCE family protein [Rhodococcus globerulus]